MNRKASIERFQNEEFDVCIIGAGASGAGAALDAALRGLRVALIDRGDFAGETSSRSTKLIHGGVRYLEQAIKKLDLAQLRQVRHGLAERRTVIRNAPHLAHPLALLTPVFSLIEGIYITIGLRLYDFFARHDAFPKGRWLSKKEAIAQMPTLTPNMHSAVQYYDGQLDDARYALALAHSAAEAGAAVATYINVTGFERNGQRLTAALVEDKVTDRSFPLKARVFLNCTGPYADAIRLLANPSAEPRIRPSKGVHITLPRQVLQSDSAMLIPKTADGRVVFAIPFEDKVFVGTTDNDYTEGQHEPVLEPNEVQYLLDTLRPYVANVPNANEVQAGFGGIRPLIVSNRANTKALLRDHEVEEDAESGLLSLLGGKWTTYRLMAQDAIDQVAQRLNNSAHSTTATHFLVGGENYRFDNWQKLQQAYQLPADVCQHLMKAYGNRAEGVASLIRENNQWAKRIDPKYPYVQAEVVYQVREEMAVTIRDVLARRWRLELLDWRLTSDVTPVVADLMATELNWSLNEKHQYVKYYQTLIADFIQKAGLQKNLITA
ncbi:glycerol-3-phosphate dehydrogenase/oxidase [Spirosoma pomorum]